MPVPDHGFYKFCWVDFPPLGYSRKSKVKVSKSHAIRNDCLSSDHLCQSLLLLYSIVDTNNRETSERKDIWGKITTSAKTISTDLYVYDIEILRNNEKVALAILGYGAVTSFIFIFIAMMRGLGNSFPPDKQDLSPYLFQV